MSYTNSNTAFDQTNLGNHNTTGLQYRDKKVDQFIINTGPSNFALMDDDNKRVTRSRNQTPKKAETGVEQPDENMSYCRPISFR